MNDYRERRAVLACLRREPELDEFLRIAAKGEFKTLLRWLDESGLALYLGQRLQDCGAREQVDARLRHALNARTEANRRRTFVLLSEFGRVNAALQQSQVRYAVVKGFSLTNEYCPALWLRHQSDIDLLVDAGDAAGAIEALRSLGYALDSDERSGEICMAIRSGRLPSARDFIYGWPQDWHVEIHTKFYEGQCGVSLDVGESWMEHMQWREIGEVQFPSLGLAHGFVMQVLHVFRHIGSWARTAWLYEIAHFVERFGGEHELWSRIDALLEPKVRDACGVVCVMVANAFGTKFPTMVDEKWITPLPRRQVAWIAQYAERWMLSDFLHGSKTGLLLQREFADSRVAWWKYRAFRYRKALRALRQSDKTGPRFLAERARKQMEYLRESLRWSR